MIWLVLFIVSGFFFGFVSSKLKQLETAFIIYMGALFFILPYLNLFNPMGVSFDDGALNATIFWSFWTGVYSDMNISRNYYVFHLLAFFCGKISHDIRQFFINFK